ncbi:aminopeptidase [Desulfonatronum sp. SC1]|uniref:aminopeptidase n=1 Tax=Desulfonatronum sp. SC1 TaxID=2109626 RepID=UPI000D306EC0|nr:aminopeptidase [Desulfonatronum sp. SC1]PTN32436.1 aminopeptidase [Desulfonatronum sp. SC1]
MLTEKHLDAYAQVMIWALDTARGRKPRKGNIVLLQSDPAASALAEKIYALLLRRSLQPVVRWNPTVRMEHDFYALGEDKQLTFHPPGTKELLGALHGAIHLRAPESLTHLRDVHPERISLATLARKPLRDILDAREHRKLFGWTLAMLPTQAMAQAAGMDLDAYTGQIVNACYLDADDAVAAWREVFDAVGRIKRWLNKMNPKTLRVESEGMDLEVSLGEQRKWVGLSGHNIPSFEIFLSPDWRGVRGVYVADQLSYRNGNLVSGVRLEFTDGRVTCAQAEQGEAFLRSQVAMDPGAAQVGEFSLTDKRFSRINAFMANTLFDENYGGEHGNCHLALGSSYVESFSGKAADLDKRRKRDLGFNESALHWDLVNTRPKVVTARLRSGKSRVIYENGEFSC